MEESLERMREHGALPESFDGEEILTVMTLGKQALLTDPSGAWIGLWEPITFPGIGIMMVPGAPFWFEHMSPDPGAAAQFYADCFRLDVVNHGDEYWTIQAPGSGQDAYGFSFPRDRGDARATWFVLLLTTDLDTSAALVRERTVAPWLGTLLRWTTWAGSPTLLRRLESPTASGKPSSAKQRNRNARIGRSEGGLVMQHPLRPIFKLPSSP